ncbi:MAG: hypothetical protein ACYSWO_28240 [Planctomycetota bacterium]|jgi:hypothetical protein
MAKSVPDPIFPDAVWDGTTQKWPDVNTDKTPDVEFGARYRAEIRSLEEQMLPFLDMLGEILAYGSAGEFIAVKGDGTGLEYRHYLGINKKNDNASTINIGQPVYVKSDGDVDLAKADAAATTKVAGIVADTSIAAAATGVIAVGGMLTATTTQWDAVTGDTGGLTPGATYYLDPDTAGKLTDTAPTTELDYVARVGYAESTTRLVIDIEPTILL